jgi:glucose-1-phosphate cytidylyltransferase
MTSAGFGSCMDTLEEKNMLEERWAWGDAPWKTWDDTAPLALAR